MAVNDSYAELMRARREDLVGRRLQEIFSAPEMVRPLHEALERVWRTGLPQRVGPQPLSRLRPNGGCPFPGSPDEMLSCVLLPVLGPEGRAHHVVKYLISESGSNGRGNGGHDAKAGEGGGVERGAKSGVSAAAGSGGADPSYRALLESAGRLRAIVDTAVDGIISIDESGSMLAFNLAAERMFGYPATEVLGRNVKMLMPEPYRSEHDTYLLNYRDTGERKIIGIGREVRGLRKDGSEFPMDLAVSETRLADRVVFTGIVRDITERKTAEEALRQSEERARLMAEAIPQIVWTARADGSITHFNRRWRDYTGLMAEEGLGEAWRSAIHPDDAPSALEAWEHALQSGSEHQVEYRLRKAGGAYRWHLARAVPLRDLDGRVREWFGTLTDVDDRRRAEEQLRHTQKLESVGILAGGVAHDFNNLLTGIMGNGSLALEVLSPSSPARPMLEALLRAGERAAGLTHQMLAYAGKSQFALRRLDLSTLVREITELIQTSIPKKVALQLQLGRDLPPVKADGMQLQQLVMNLVINGAEAIEQENGMVLITSGLQEVTEDYIQEIFGAEDLRPGIYLTLEVHDTGAGMDGATQARIFDPFFTTKFAGRGLGLSAVMGIVRGHKGAIRVYSTPGKGTSFKILLPAAPPEFAAAEVAREPVSELRGTGTILVVDDEDSVRTVARFTLERFGYQVVLAQDGHDAIEIFQRMADQISLVLLDMTMPVVSGDEVFDRLREIRPDIPVVASSGYNRVAVLQRVLLRGPVDFLAKPYTSGALAAKVKEVLSTSAAAPRRTPGS